MVIKPTHELLVEMGDGTLNRDYAYNEASLEASIEQAKGRMCLIFKIATGEFTLRTPEGRYIPTSTTHPWAQHMLWPVQVGAEAAVRNGLD